MDAPGTDPDSMTGDLATPQTTRVSYQHASGLHGVSRALSQLHAQLLRQGDDAAVRTSVMNLVAACDTPMLAERAAATLLQIGTRHPARAIVVLARPDAHQSGIEADLSVHCGTSRLQICTELVRLQVRGDAAYHLTSVVLPLLVPDMPVQLWVVGAPRLQQAFSEEVVAMTESIILDSGAYRSAAETLKTLADQLAFYGDRLQLTDLAWERTQVWRDALAQGFDGPRARPFARSINHVSIESSGEVTADAWLLAGWLGDRLDGVQQTQPSISVRRSAGADGSAARPHGAVARVVITAEADRRLQVAVEASATALCTSISIDGEMLTSGTISITGHSDAELIGDAMAEGGADPLYRLAVPRAAAQATARP